MQFNTVVEIDQKSREKFQIYAGNQEKILENQKKNPKIYKTLKYQNQEKFQKIRKNLKKKQQ